MGLGIMELQLALGGHRAGYIGVKSCSWLVGGKAGYNRDMSCSWLCSLRQCISGVGAVAGLGWGWGGLGITGWGSWLWGGAVHTGVALGAQICGAAEAVATQSGCNVPGKQTTAVQSHAAHMHCTGHDRCRGGSQR